MSATTLALAGAAADGDSTHAALIFAPSWINNPHRLSNDTVLSVDTSGTAHRPGSQCWGMAGVYKAGQITLIKALVGRKLCDRGCI